MVIKNGLPGEPESTACTVTDHDRPLNHLPFDVWSEIVSYISTSDLVHLCIVSSTFLSIFRPLLYRVVVFDDRYNWTPIRTLDLLARDAALANAVVQLDFFCCDPIPKERAILNLVAIANLTSLRRFRFSGRMFRTEAEQEQFWRILSAKISTSLEQLTYRPRAFDSPRPCYGDRYRALGGLKTVEWSPWTIENLDPLWSVLSRSLQTLTSLALPDFAFLGHEYPHLASLHFPNLRAFRIHPCSNPVQSSLAHGARMTNFVLVHDTIEELHLGTRGKLDAALLNAESLPRLRAFSGFLSKFNLMMSAQLTSLSTTFHRLTVYLEPSVWEIDTMFSLVQSSRGDATPTRGRLLLQRVKFSSLGSSFHLLKQIISGCAESFACTLEVLIVDICQIDLESGLLSTLTSLFEPFKRLRVVIFNLISRNYRSYYVLSSEERAQLLRFALPFVQGLFEQCASLREVRIYMSEVEHSWLVSRTPDGRGEHCPSDDCTGHLLYVPTRHRPPVMA